MQKEATSAEILQVSGDWWLPESPAEHVSGVLRHSTEGWTTLKLERSLKDHSVEDGPGYRRLSFAEIPVPVVLGIASDGRGCTLMGGIEVGSTVLASTLLIGEFWEPESDPEFECAELRISELEEWSEHSPFSLPPTDTQRLGHLDGFVKAMSPFYPIPALERADPYELRVAYGRKKLLDLDLNSRACHVEVWSMTAPSISFYKSASVDHGVLVHVQPPVPQRVSWYTRSLADLVNLFSFLVGRRTYPTKVTLFRSPGGAHDRGCEVDLFGYRGKTSQLDTPRPEEIPLPFRFIQPVAQQAFEAWFSNAESMRPVHQILLETLPPDDADLESVNLRLAQAVEVYFRRCVGRTYVGSAEYEKYYDAMLKALPQDVPSPLRSRLRSHLKYGNEYSLKNVVKHLVQALGKSTRVALSVNDADAFGRLAAGTRNYLAHHTGQEGPVASTTRDYLELNRTLRALLYGSLAMGMGLADATVAQCVSKVRAGV